MILIFNGQIAGQSTTADNLPAGFTAIEAPIASLGLPLDQLWFDGENIQVKSERPSDRHYWSDTDWAEMPKNIVPVHEDWAGLVADLRESGLMAKVYAAAKKTVKATTAWTMFMTALTSPVMVVEDLAFAICDFRLMAPDVLDAEDCQLILGFLHDRGFFAESLDQALQET